jgi:regulatory protein
MPQNNLPTYKHLLKYSLWLLGRKEVSEKMLTSSLRKRFPEAALDDEVKVLDYLKDNQYLSDSRFAEMFIRYGKAKKWGPMKIKFKLKEKGISAELIEQMEPAWNESRIEELIDYCVGKFKLENNDWKSLPYDEKSKFRNRIMRHLASKGFGMGAINEVMSKI